ncbi:hypothetical protein ESB00_10800 [Oleiharenicola lentus]|uniref:EF-hand domain-containing protein n=1 Tax=Oleiharenicola lentus TaxID=2508720 RepID=A0A4Q1CBM5_9BACT|nr:hypothetical protein [Oleiharenicola lentus]RXK56331.1 hypothetical protein ESB00_10800 [Oleiharenicola lentus]
MKSLTIKATYLIVILLAAPFAFGAEAGKPKQGQGGPFANADTNKDGKLDPAEFAAMNKQNPNPDAAKKRFARLDVDKDGFLSADELRSGRKQGEKKRDKAERGDKSAQ